MRLYFARRRYINTKYLPNCVAVCYTFRMKAVVSVIGTDKTGIIAAVSGKLAEWNINIEDISQTIMQNNFVMIMLVDAENSTVPFDKLGAELDRAVAHLGVVVHVQHEDLFDAMQRV